MPPNAPDHTEGKEEFSQQIEKSIDDRIRELQTIDKQKGEALQQLKSAIVEKIVMPKLDESGQITGSKIDDLRLDETEMVRVFELLKEDPTVKDLLDQSGLKTPEDFMAFLGLRELSSNKLGLQKGPTTINEDTNIFSANGKMLGIVFRGETAQITDATQKMIQGQPHVLAKVTHDLGRYRPKYVGKTKEYTGYVPTKTLQGNAAASTEPEPEPPSLPRVYSNPDRAFITKLPEDGKWHPSNEVTDGKDPNIEKHPEIHYMAEKGELYARLNYGERYGQKGVLIAIQHWNRQDKKWENEKQEIDLNKIDWQKAYEFVINDIIEEAEAKNISPQKFDNFIDTYLHQDHVRFYKDAIEKSGHNEEKFKQEAVRKYSST